MKHLVQKIPAATAIAGSAILALGLVCYCTGARINTSRSIAVGLYWTSETRPGRGDYVLLCPPRMAVMEDARRRGYLASGFCPGQFGYLMKKILASGGDVVSITDAGVSVNGALLPLSAPLMHDRAGQALPRFRTSSLVLGQSEVLLMSDASATSFDGRYFGPVDRSQIRTVIVPVLTWPDATARR